MAVMVTGSRDWTERTIIRGELARYAAQPSKVLIHGDARGADRIAAQIADGLDFHLMACPADWKRHGRAAGPIRNRKMLDTNPDVVLAFQKNGSRGTQDAIDEALRRGIPVVRWSVRDDYTAAERHELIPTSED